MSPEAKIVIGQFADHLVKHVVPSEETLEKEVAEAMKAKNFRGVELIAQKLQKLPQTREAIYKKTHELNELLEELGMANLDIPGFDYQFPSQKEMPVTPTAEQGKRKKIQYVEGDIDLHVLQALTAKNKVGRFIYPSKKSIARAIIAPESIKDKGKAWQAARVDTAVEKVRLRIRKLQEQMEQKGKDDPELLEIVTVGEMAREWQTKAEDKFKNFYEFMASNYGEMKISEFIEQVINRFQTGRQPREILASEKKEFDSGAEIVLCNALKKALPKIREKILGDQMPKSRGYKPEIRLDLTCIRLATKQGKKIISSQEARFARTMIVQFIENMAEGRERSWATSREHFPFWYLGEIVKKIRTLPEANSKTNEFISLLFSGPKFNVAPDGTVSLCK